MPDESPASHPFELLERSNLFVFVRHLIQQVYAQSVKTAVNDFGLVIVGGQSLALWARQYLIDELTGEDIGFVTSDDLDFIGNNAGVDHCERVMGASFKRATMDDNTPSLAIGLIDWEDDKELIVDILKMDSVGGVEKKEILKHLAVLDLDGVDVAVIDPITCLKSRLFNLFAYWQRDRGRESVRVNIAIRASESYIREMLVYEGFRVAAVQVKRIKALALSRLGKRAYVEYGIDVLRAIPYDPALYPEAYLGIEYPNMIRQVSDQRRRKLVQYQSFGTTPIHESHETTKVAGLTTHSHAD